MMITLELFERDRACRVGTANPERMRVELWERLFREERATSAVRSSLGLGLDFELSDEPSFVRRAADWSWDRFGQSVTRMPDGREILIAGEHEDCYDPDFHIYNDVLVRRPDGSVEIYGYPLDVFPPTDFHTATLLGSKILLIGCMGYVGTRKPGATPCFELDTNTYEIRRIETTGACPGWISSHHAVFDAEQRAITVYGGNVVVDVDGKPKIREHYGRHKLHLDSMRWEVLATGHAWAQISVGLQEPFEAPVGTPSPEACMLYFSFHSSIHEILDRDDTLTGRPPVRVRGRESQAWRFVCDQATIRIDCVSESLTVIVESELPQARISRFIDRLKDILQSGTGRAWKSRPE